MLINVTTLEPLIGIEQRLHKRTATAVILRPWGFLVHEKPVVRKCSCTLLYVTKFMVDTPGAAAQLTRLFGSVEYAGLKDTEAVTAQYFSTRIQGKGVIHVSHGKSQVSASPVGSGCVTRGAVAVNEFSIALMLLEGRVELDFDDYVPNFYGYQRFGTRRPNTHIIGKLLALGEYHTLVKEFQMTYPLESGALGWYEKRYINAIQRTRDAKTAIKKLPRGLIEIFGNALQAYLYNRILSMLLRDYGYETCSLNCVPIPGCTSINVKLPLRLEYIAKYVLEEEGLSQDDLCRFKEYGVKLKTICRKPCIKPVYGSLVELEDDVKIVIVVFALESGAYATTFLGEYFVLLEPYPYILADQLR